MPFIEEVASLEVDENLSLKYTLTEGSPIVTIYNSATRKKKHVYMAWFLSGDREMTLRTFGQGTKSYAVSDIQDYLRDIVEAALAHPVVKAMIWNIYRTLTEMLHTPMILRREAEYRMLPESKKNYLWLGWTPFGENSGGMIPCFPLGEPEESALKPYMMDCADRWGNLYWVPGASVGAIQRNGIPMAFVRSNSPRWHTPIMTAAAAAVLGAVESLGDGENNNAIAHKIWSLRNKTSAGMEPERADLMNAAGSLMMQARAFVRHYDAICDIAVSRAVDAGEQLQKQGFSRMEMLDIHADDLGVGGMGRTDYRATRYRDSSGCEVLVYHPRNDSSIMDWVLSIPPGKYDAAMNDDSCGTQPDTMITVVNMLRGARFAAWCKQVQYLIGNVIPT